MGHDGGMLPKKVDVPVRKDMVLFEVSTYGGDTLNFKRLRVARKKPRM